MKSARTFAALLVGIAIGAFAGWVVANLYARAVLISGPYSDNYGPARSEIAHALEKLRAGDTNIFEHLTGADDQIREAQEWSKRFLGQKK